MSFERIKCVSRDDWLAKRSKGLGGSDAACIIGRNRWKTNQQLYREKIGEAEAEDIRDNPAVKYGVSAEGSLRQLFRLDFPELKLYYRNNEILQNKKLPYLQASVDGELEDQNGRKGILEIKTTTIHSGSQSEDWRDRVPDTYYCQILHYLLVTGYDFAILKAHIRYEFPDGLRIVTNHYHFEREEHIESLKYLLRAEIKFWEQIQSRTEPALILPSL